MTAVRITSRVLLLTAVAALSSCIDTREEYWLEADGSGRAAATYELPLAVARMHGGPDGIRKLLEDFLKNTPEIRSSDCKVNAEGNHLRVDLRVAFDSALELRNVASGGAIRELPSAASNLAGTIQADIQGRNLAFSRVISVSNALPGASFLPASQLEGHRMVYVMHLPAAAEESNATRTEDSGRTLIWEIPLQQALEAPVTTRFKMAIPIPWKWVTGVALPFSLAGVFVIVRIRRSRMRKTKSPAS